MKQTIITITGEGNAIEMEIKSTDYVIGKTVTFSYIISKEIEAKSDRKNYMIRKQVLNKIITLCQEVAAVVPDKNVIISEIPKQ